ncbi:hypothetical protein, conserved [Leishmania lindenbergi]|uniref:RBD domain-containing protein n=1 Tax=Leishmania lindenbergi TaxID=651832 RepID=A0AAW3AUW5_9TRYP
MSRACTPALGLGENTQVVPDKKANRGDSGPHNVVLSPPLEPADEEHEHASPSSVVLLSCSSDDTEVICCTQLKGAAAPIPSPLQLPLTQARLLALQPSPSDRNLAALAPTNPTATFNDGQQTGTMVVGVTHPGNDTIYAKKAHRERVMSWLAGTSASPNHPLGTADDETTDGAPCSSGVQDGPHTPPPPHSVTSSALALYDTSTQPLLLPSSGSACTGFCSPPGAESSLQLGGVPSGCVLDAKTPVRCSATERAEDSDDNTSPATRSAPLRQARVPERDSDYRDACCTPPHPWRPSVLHAHSVQEVPVAASDRSAVSTDRGSPRRTPPPLPAMLLPFMTSPLPRRPSVELGPAKERPTPSPALSAALRDAKNRETRQESSVPLSMQADVATASVSRATGSHGNSENEITLRVCTLSGLTLRVTVDQRLSAAVLAQRVAQYLQLRGAQVQLKYTRTGDVFDAASTTAKGIETSTAKTNTRLCDLPGLQPSDVFVVLLRAQRGEPSSSSPLPSRLSTAGGQADRTPSSRASSASSVVRLSRRPATAAKRPRQSTLAPSQPALTIVESPPPLARAHKASGIRTDASAPSLKSEPPPLSNRLSSDTRCPPLTTPSPVGAVPVVHPREGRHRCLGTETRLSLTPAVAPAAGGASASQAAAPTAASGYATSTRKRERAGRLSASSYCHPPLTRSQTHHL